MPGSQKCTHIKWWSVKKKQSSARNCFSLNHSESSSCRHQKWRLPLWTILIDRENFRVCGQCAHVSVLCNNCILRIREANARIAGIEKQQSEGSRWSAHKQFCRLQSTSTVHIYCNAACECILYTTGTGTQPFVVTASVLQNCRFYESRLSSVSARVCVCVCLSLAMTLPYAEWFEFEHLYTREFNGTFCTNSASVERARRKVESWREWVFYCSNVAVGTAAGYWLAVVRLQVCS